MREASFELMGLPPRRNGTPMSLQNDCKDGTFGDEGTHEGLHSGRFGGSGNTGGREAQASVQQAKWFDHYWAWKGVDEVGNLWGKGEEDYWGSLRLDHDHNGLAGGAIGCVERAATTARPLNDRSTCKTLWWVVHVILAPWWACVMLNRWGRQGRISMSMCHVMWCSRMFHHLLLLLCTAACSSASSQSNRRCCRGSGMRTRGGRMGLEWGGWVRNLRWGRGRGRCLWIYSDVTESFGDDVIWAENWILFNWMGIEELNIIQVFSPLINVDEHFPDCWRVDTPEVYLGVDSAGFKEGAEWFNQIANKGGGGRSVAKSRRRWGGRQTWVHSFPLDLYLYSYNTALHSILQSCAAFCSRYSVSQTLFLLFDMV